MTPIPGSSRQSASRVCRGRCRAGQTEYATNLSTAPDRQKVCSFQWSKVCSFRLPLTPFFVSPIALSNSRAHFSRGCENDVPNSQYSLPNTEIARIQPRPSSEPVAVTIKRSSASKSLASRFMSNMKSSIPPTTPILWITSVLVPRFGYANATRLHW